MPVNNTPSPFPAKYESKLPGLVGHNCGVFSVLSDPTALFWWPRVRNAKNAVIFLVMEAALSPDESFLTPIYIGAPAS